MARSQHQRPEAPAVAASLDPPPAGFGRGVGRTLLATSFGFALIQLDVTVVNVALPHIGTSLGTGVAGLQWIVDGYALVFAALLLTAGFFGDRFGGRRVYLAGFALFAAASTLCGLATGIGALVAGRALQGVGAAAMLPASLALLNHASGHDRALRAWAIGWWTAAGSITIALGPVVGGLILGVASWRAIFLVNLPVCALGAYLTWHVPETERAAPAPGVRRGFDPLGQVLGVVALATLTGAVIEAKPLGLADPRIWLAFVVGAGAAAAFILAEARAEAPMMPLSLFRAPGFAVCVLYGMAVNFTFYGAIFILSLYLQDALGYGAVATGLAYLPLTATFFVSNVLSGRLTAQFGSRLPMIAGALVDAAGFALFLGLGLGSSYWAMLVPFALLPLGMGTGVPAMTTAVLAGVAKEQAGTAAGVLNAARQTAGALGVALFGALAGGGGAPGIVHGLHLAAGTAVVLLVGAAAAALRVREETPG